MVHWTHFDSAPSKYNLISIALYKQTALARLSIYCHDSMGQNRSKSSDVTTEVKDGHEGEGLSTGGAKAFHTLFLYVREIY